MGAPAGNMADALFTQTKQRVLGPIARSERTN